MMPCNRSRIQYCEFEISLGASRQRCSDSSGCDPGKCLEKRKTRKRGLGAEMIQIPQFWERVPGVRLAVVFPLPAMPLHPILALSHERNARDRSCRWD